MMDDVSHMTTALLAGVSTSLAGSVPVAGGGGGGGAGGRGGGGGQPDLLPLLGWVGVGVALAIVAGVVLVAIRKRMLSRQSQASESASMFQQIRDLRDRGELTEEEFNAIRTKLVERAKGSAPVVDGATTTRKPLTSEKLDSFPRSEGSDGPRRSQMGDV